MKKVSAWAEFRFLVGPDYMENFSPVTRAGTSSRVLKEILKWKWRLHGEGWSRGWISVSETGLGFSARPNGLKNPCNRYHFFQPGLKKERKHAHRLCFHTSVNFLIEICVLRPSRTCNRNNISGRWAERNFSPGWNSPCNQALRCKHFNMFGISQRKNIGVIRNENVSFAIMASVNRKLKQSWRRRERKCHLQT